MTICTPAKILDEFIITENAFNNHEGPDGFFKKPATSDSTQSFHTEFHMFAPISPKLMIVLRSSLLPSPGESKTKQMHDGRIE